MTKYKYEYYSVWKRRPNKNTNIIRLEKIDRIRIRIPVFGLNYSNNIQIPNYSLTSDGQLIKALKRWSNCTLIDCQITSNRFSRLSTLQLMFRNQQIRNGQGRQACLLSQAQLQTSFEACEPFVHKSLLTKTVTARKTKGMGLAGGRR